MVTLVEKHIFILRGGVRVDIREVMELLLEKPKPKVTEEAAKIGAVD
jgi:hypothetical protein